MWCKSETVSFQPQISHPVFLKILFIDISKNLFYICI